MVNILLDINIRLKITLNNKFPHQIISLQGYQRGFVNSKYKFWCGDSSKWNLNIVGIIRGKFMVFCHNIMS